MKTEKNGHPASSPSRKRASEYAVWLFVYIGFALGVYGIALSAYVVPPWWTKEGSIMLTVVFFGAITVLSMGLGIIATLWFRHSKRLDHVEAKVKHPWLHTEENGLYGVFSALQKRIINLEEKRQVRKAKRKGAKG